MNIKTTTGWEEFHYDNRQFKPIDPTDSESNSDNDSIKTSLAMHDVGEILALSKPIKTLSSKFGIYNKGTTCFMNASIQACRMYEFGDFGNFEHYLREYFNESEEMNTIMLGEDSIPLMKNFNNYRKQTREHWLKLFDFETGPHKRAEHLVQIEKKYYENLNTEDAHTIKQNLRGFTGQGDPTEFLLKMILEPWFPDMTSQDVLNKLALKNEKGEYCYYDDQQDNEAPSQLKLDVNKVLKLGFYVRNSKTFAIGQETTLISERDEILPPFLFTESDKSPIAKIEEELTASNWLNIEGLGLKNIKAQKTYVTVTGPKQLSYSNRLVQQSGQQDLKYIPQIDNIKAVILHKGISEIGQTGGHYICLVRNNIEQDEFLKCDDEEVTEICSREAEHMLSKRKPLLFVELSEADKVVRQEYKKQLEQDIVTLFRPQPLFQEPVDIAVKISKLLESASKGASQDQYYLGEILCEDQTFGDMNAGIEWLRKSAMQGNRHANLYLHRLGANVETPKTSQSMQKNMSQLENEFNQLIETYNESNDKHNASQILNSCSIAMDLFLLGNTKAYTKLKLLIKTNDHWVDSLIKKFKHKKVNGSELIKYSALIAGLAQTKHSEQSDEALKFLEIEGINHSDSQILLIQTYLERNNIKKAKEYADKILHNSDITEEQKKMIQDQLSEKVNE
tara:strand:- start:9970 stop:12000 length:2031 start_codon:yes stop_codon:yes gene_type:complete